MRAEWPGVGLTCGRGWRSWPKLNSEIKVLIEHQEHVGTRIRAYHQHVFAVFLASEETAEAHHYGGDLAELAKLRQISCLGGGLSCDPTANTQPSGPGSVPRSVPRFEPPLDMLYCLRCACKSCATLSLSLATCGHDICKNVCEEKVKETDHFVHLRQRGRGIGDITWLPFPLMGFNHILTTYTPP